MKKTISKMILMLVMIAIAGIHSQAQVTLINYDNSTSTGGRAPNGSWLFSNAVYLIKPSEMTSSGYGANVVTSVGWLYNLVSVGSQSLVTTGTLDVYMQNTTDAAYNKSSSFASSLPGMTKIISTTISIPMTISTFTIDVPAGGPGTSTFSTIAGQGLYIAFAYHTTSALSTTSAVIACNSGGLNPGLYNYASQTDNGDLMGPTAFRPVTRLGHVCNLSPPTISGNTSFCAGGSTILDAGSGYAGWLWSTGATTQTISVTTAGTFTVTVTDVNQCTESSSAVTTVNPIPDAIVPADTAICNGTLLPTGTFNFSTVANFGFGGKILIVYSEGGATPTQLRNNLLATPGVSQVDLFDAYNSGTPGLALMQAYDMVVSYNSFRYSDPVSLGNNLADYVDANGTVVICAVGFYNSSIHHPTGRWDTGNYSPYNLSPTIENTTRNLGTFTAGHPLMAGVSALTSGAHNVVSVAGGATEVAQWDNGHSLIAFKGRVVGITAFVGSSVTWTGDFAKVIVNAGNWINGTTTFSWTNNNPATGLAASGTGNSLPAFTATNATSAPVTATITVTASNTNVGATCTDTASFTITVNPTPSPIINGNLSFCAGSSTTLDAGVFAGYNWSTGATTQTINVNTPGDYTVTVTDGNGCTGSVSATVTMNLPMLCLITGGDFCPGSSTQLCAATSSSYLWSTGATTQCITVTTGGTYTVTTSNASGCTSSCSKTIGIYPLPACSITGSNFCNGSGTQLCTPAVPGGVSYFYLWSTGATTQCITVTAGGTYTVTVTDYNGCTNSCSKTVTEYPKPPCLISGSDFCSGSGTQLCTSTAPAAVLYTFLWSTGATTQCITVTSGGTYTITVTDANGCSGSCSKTVTAYPLPVCSISGGNFCSGSSTQLCAATNSSYLWSTGATTQCITVNTGGTYTVTVTDANGCTNSCSKTVTEYPKPACSITGNNFCSGSGSQLCAASVPGPSVNTYLWNTGSTTQCITVTSDGTYTVTVTNANGCTNSCSKTVTEYPKPACSITGNNFCSGSGSQLCAASVPGPSVNTYLWNTGSTTQCITVTSGGTYTVTVTNANGCTNSCSKAVTEYPKPACSITGNNFCSGSGSQLCAASVPGPSVNTYLWNTGSTTQCITVTSGGTYTVTVTNANGCTGSCSKTVTAYPLPACTISGNIAYCDGSTTQLCGTPGMSSYLWSTGATTQCIAAAGGDYTVTVTNANGCTSSCSITTHLRLVPVCSITGGNFCSGSSSQLCATTAPVGYVFSYAWSTGATTQCITLTTGGTYTVNITNQYGCSSSCSKTITVSPTPVCAISGNIAYCEGSTTQLCGTPGMNSYLWSTGATTQCIAAAGGDYTVTVTNANGCTSSCSITTHLRLLPVCSITGNNFCSGSSSQLCATTAPAGYVFSYIWSTGATTQCITITAGGTYTVTISNQYGCTSSCSKAITKYPLPTCSVTGSASVCQGNSTQWCAPAGLASYLWSNGATTQCITVSTVTTYTVTVTNTTGCTKSCSKTLTIKALPNCTVTGTASVCPGSSTQWCAPAGLASYLWSSGATTQCITVNVAGTYTVTVTNTGGCTKSCSKTLTIKAVPTCNITGTASICPGGATQWCAPAGLTAYLWSNGATTQCISVSTAAVYTVTVTNAGGCTSSCSKTLTIKTPPSCAINGGNICQGGSTQLCASAAAANYLWSTGATTKCISVSAAGIYTVTVTGTNGCTNSCSKNVTVSSSPSCAITWNHALCQGGSAQLCAGAGLSSYLWNTGATSQCITISATGDYTVTVTNGSGCTSSCTVKSVAQPVPVCSITGNSVVSPGQTTPVCAPPGLTYLWNNGATTQCRNVTAGTYTVTVTNANDCTSLCSKTVTSAAKMAEPVVIGGDNGAIEASAYPNPFNREATIEFRNTIASGHVVVELFNLTGSKMAVLFDKDVEQNVTYQTKVHSEDLSEGVYFYRIVSGDNVITGKLILLKE